MRSDLMKKRNDEIYRRIRAGETGYSLAPEYKISRQRIHEICLLTEERIWKSIMDGSTEDKIAKNYEISIQDVKKICAKIIKWKIRKEVKRRIITSN